MIKSAEIKRPYPLDHGGRPDQDSFIRINKTIKVSSFDSSENIIKKEGGPDSTVSNSQFSSVTLNERQMKARKRACYNFEFQRGSQPKDLYKSKSCQNSKFA